MREEMDRDVWYHICCIKQSVLEHPCGSVQWHHEFIYAGRRQNVKWGILPVCVWIHEREKRKDISKLLEDIMHLRAPVIARVQYPKHKWPKQTK